MTGRPTIGVIANPLSGKDVRRIAARGAVATNEDKRNRIARAVVGAVSSGVESVVVMDEPFGIASGAVRDIRLAIDVEVLDVGRALRPETTAAAAIQMRELGVDVIVVLGGDGTNRIISMAWPEVTLAPMSTGTNNVFPTPIEPTIIGAAAGLVATGQVDPDRHAPKSKIVHVTDDSGADETALIDAVVLVDDFVGNRMPYEPSGLRQLVVSRSEPTAIGVSAIAGRVEPCAESDEAGVLVECGPGGRPVTVPLGPGLFRTVEVRSSRRLELGEQVSLDAVGENGRPGIVAFDGDRLLSTGPDVTAVVRRDGPRVVDVPGVMQTAATTGAFDGAARGLDDDLRRGPAAT